MALILTKLNDVKRLLTKHFGQKWSEFEEHEFYNNLINVQETSYMTLKDAEEESLCEENPMDSFIVETEMFIQNLVNIIFKLCFFKSL